MSLWTLSTADISHRICVTLLHSLWQITLIALMVALVCRWRRRTVQQQYRLYVAALLLSVVTVPLTLIHVAHNSPSIQPITAVALRSAIEPAATPPPFSETQTPDRVSTTTPRPSANEVGSADPAAAGAVDALSIHAESSAAKIATGNWHHAPTWIAGLYLLGMLVMLARLGLDVIRAERIRLRGRAVTDGPLLSALCRLADRWSLHVLPGLATAEQIVVPQVVGLLKPTVLMPASALTGLSADQIEMILAHELAHVRRYDMWINLLQRVAESVLFFNPALWLISRRIGALREFCCDEFACTATSNSDSNFGTREDCDAADHDYDSRQRYAQALLHVVEASRPPQAALTNLATVAAAGHSPSELRRRIARLLGQPLPEPVPLSRGGIAVLLVLLPLMWASLTWQANAQQAKPEPTSPANTTNDDANAESTEADPIVALARSKTFGLQNVAKIAFRQTIRQINLPAMQSYGDREMASLWKARGSQVSDEQIEANQMETRVAWDGNQLLLSSRTSYQPDQSWRQTHFWDGQNGWIGEIRSVKGQETKNVYRYPTLEKLTEHVHPFSYPHWAAAGDRLPWPGPDVLIAEYSIDPEQTHYQLIGTETIDGETCDLYAGPQRSEQVWISRSTKLVKAVSRHYVSSLSDDQRWSIASEAAGKPIHSQEEYTRHRESLTAEQQTSLGARWSAAAWRFTHPGNLTVFSDYEEISPGIHWPTKADRVVVHSNGRSEKSFKYYLSKIDVEVVKEFDIDEFAADALPDPGVKVTDRTGEAWFEYVWSDQLTQADIERQRAEVIAKKSADDEQKRRTNATPIDTVDDAIEILTDGPRLEPTMVWARAIKFLSEHPETSLPALIRALDNEQRDHPISKLAFALRALGDTRAVPALIRAFPRTLLPSRSDYGLLLDEDVELRRFMQTHDLDQGIGGTDFSYGRAFREVTGALHKLTGQRFDEMELNWINLIGTPTQRRTAQQQFDRVSKQWADWWESNWQDHVHDPAFSKVNLQLTDLSNTRSDVTGKPLAGPNVQIEGGLSGGVIQSVHDTGTRCFFDLDTGRQADWPDELPSLGKTRLDSPEFLDWARREGFDVAGVTYTPDGDDEPLCCLLPLGLSAWKISEQDHRDLEAMAHGDLPYPLSNPVKLLVPRRTIPEPRDPQHSGDSFLFVTGEGTTGVLRLTAQVTNTEDRSGDASGGDYLFGNFGFDRGVKYAYRTFSE